MKRLLTAVFAVVLVVGSLVAPGIASAASILLWDDFIHLTDVWNQAITTHPDGHTLTTATGEADFVSKVGLGGWDLVVLQVDSTNRPGAESAIATWVGAGNKAIYSNFTSAEDAAFQVVESATYGGVYNGDMTVLAPLTAPATVSPNPVGWINPVYGVSGRTFTLVGGATTAATLNATADPLNGDFTLTGSAFPAIVIGNSGRTIINGFLGETIGTFDINSGLTSLTATEIAIYQNEISFLLASAPPPAPVPASAVLVALGIVTLGWRAVARRRAD
jgi:hypothetical protein